MAKRVQDPVELCLGLGFELDDGIGTFKGRNVRYLDHAGVVEIGDDDFDRWANSVEFSFDVFQPKGQRQLARWAEQFEETKR